MFKNWNFTSSCILILTVSLVLSGSSFLIPFFTQILLGYTAMDAGMIGLPGTICQLIIIQTIGYVSDKTDIRKIIFVGLILTTFSVWGFSTFNLNSGYNDIVLARVYYAISIGFLGDDDKYCGLLRACPDKNNSASALLNLVKMSAPVWGSR